MCPTVETLSGQAEHPATAGTTRLPAGFDGLGTAHVWRRKARARGAERLCVFDDAAP